MDNELQVPLLQGSGQENCPTGLARVSFTP